MFFEAFLLFYSSHCGLTTSSSFLIFLTNTQINHGLKYVSWRRRRRRGNGVLTFVGKTSKYNVDYDLWSQHVQARLRNYNRE